MTYFISVVWWGGEHRYMKAMQMMYVNQLVHLNSMLMGILNVFISVRPNVQRNNPCK